MDINPFDFINPERTFDGLIGSKDIFDSLRELCHVDNQDSVQNFVVVGPPESGKTSFLNALQFTDISKGFITICLKIELLGPNPLVSLVQQVFDAIFQKLIEEGRIKGDNVYYLTWRQQIDRGIRDSPIESELLRSGSRIALLMSSKDVVLNFDSQILRHDWMQLDEMILKEFPAFKGFFFILDDSTKIESEDEEVIDAFFRILNSRKRGVAVFATCGVPEKKRTQRKTMYELLQSELLPSPLEFNLVPLTAPEIYQLINMAANLKLVPFSAKLIVANLVRQASAGHPSLVKLFLHHIYTEYTRTGRFLLSSRVYRQVIDQIRVSLSLDSERDFQALENLRTKDKELFLTAAGLLLSATKSSKRHWIDRLKTLEEILRLRSLPLEIDDTEFDSALKKLIDDVNQLWELKLIQIMDDEGKPISYSKETTAIELGPKTRPISGADEMIRSYIRVVMQEEDLKINLSTSARSYLETAARGFVLDLTKAFAKPRGDEEYDISYAIRSEKMDILSASGSELAGRISDSIQEASLADFLRPDLNAMLQESFGGNLFDPEKLRGSKYWHMSIRMDESSMLESISFSIIIRTDSDIDESYMIRTSEGWRKSKIDIIDKSYGLLVHEDGILEIPKSFVENISFLLNRKERLEAYLEMFGDRNIKKLKSSLKREVPKEIKLVDTFTSEMQTALEWQSRAHESGFLSAYVGEYSLAKRCFKVAHKSEISQQVLIEDDRCVVDAYLSNFDLAIMHARNVLSFLKTTLLPPEYWKLVFIPFLKSREVMGANVILIPEFNLIWYQLQLGVLIRKGREESDYTEHDKREISDLDSMLSDEMVLSLQEASNPLHRLLAAYLFLSDRAGQAKSVLKAMIERKDEFAETELTAAQLDLDEIDRHSPETVSI